MSERLVSIIVPVFNAAPFLDELCRSIQAQTHSNFEALFLDDGSSDQSRSVLEKYAGDSRFHISGWKQNRGVMAATVELLRQMRGSYWCHPGADDVLEPTFLENRLQMAEKIPQAVIIHGPGQDIDTQGNLLPGPRLAASMPEVLECPRSIQVLLEHNIINTPSVLVNGDVTRRIIDQFSGPWRYAQDWFLWILHVATGKPLVWQPKQLHKYRVHPQSLSNDPRNAAVRDAETRLVPLCALAQARTLSSAGAESWKQWGDPLYALWLRRALKLHRAGQLDPAWFLAGSCCFHGESDTVRQLAQECLNHAVAIVRATVRDSLARRKNRFDVAGMAMIQDELFH